MISLVHALPSRGASVGGRTTSHQSRR